MPTETVYKTPSRGQTTVSGHDAAPQAIKSADPDYFIYHVDLTQISEYRGEAAKLHGTAGSTEHCRPTRSAISWDRSLIGSPGFRPPGRP